MSRIFSKLQIHGWQQEKENLLLSTILTGERALLISSPGSAKTLLAKKISKALQLSFAPFDLNAVAFEDILGVLDIPALQRGELKYLAAPGTIWNKQFVTYEEINRTKSNIQGKVLEHLRSGTINGMPTGTLWCWANMNPMGSEGTNRLAEAIMDRFSVFMWAPDALDMAPEDRAQVARAVADTDSPALAYWLKKAGGTADQIARVTDTTDYVAAGKEIQAVLMKAAQFYIQLETEMKTLPDFLALFSDVLLQGTADNKDDQGPKPIRLSGRRIGFIRRTILAHRAVELALDAELGVFPTVLQTSVQRTINAAIPYGINEDEEPNAQLRQAINSAVRQSWHRLEETDDKQASLVTRLFTSRDPLERARILLSGELKSEEAILNGWQKITSMNDRGARLLAFVVMQIDSKLRTGNKQSILPNNVLDMMKRCVKEEHIKPELPKLPGQLIPFLKDLNDIIDVASREDPVQGLVAVETVHEFVVEAPDGNWRELQRKIKGRHEDYREIMVKAGV